MEIWWTQEFKLKQATRGNAESHEAMLEVMGTTEASGATQATGAIREPRLHHRCWVRIAFLSRTAAAKTLQSTFDGIRENVQHLVKAAVVGTDLLLEDGIMKVEVVEKVSETELKVKVIRGGKLKARKGVNVPGLEIDCSALTIKDVEDAEFLL